MEVKTVIKIAKIIGMLIMNISFLISRPIPLLYNLETIRTHQYFSLIYFSSRIIEMNQATLCVMKIRILMLNSK